jgi:D-alanyl-D-alanine-carboxypeptidase/D-alanyl-D-alanine-endopeptidase
MNHRIVPLLGYFTILLTAQFTAAADDLPADAAIRAILRERIEVGKRSPGIVVGVIDEKGPRIVSYGWTDWDKKTEVNGDTVFEIGSVSKVFTGTLLADMAGQSEVSLEDPVAKYLPKAVKVPSRDGKEIRLVDLATQTSALPRMPDNFTPQDPDNPYADYTVEQLYDFLSHCALTRDIGAEYEYSNLGMGLLGHALALRAGTNYEALMVRRICDPLGMPNTRITFTPEMKAHLAPGHNAAGKAVENWDIPTLAGAGAIRSTAAELLKFVAANAGLTKTDLLPAMQLAHQARHKTDGEGGEIGLAWQITKADGGTNIWHNGQTGGYHSFIGFDPEKMRGVVVLANSETSIDDIGRHLLNGKAPLAKMNPVEGHKSIALDAKPLDGYVGRYELNAAAFFNIRRDSDHLRAQLTGQPYFDLFPESSANFFYKVVDAQITFNTNADGRATSLVLHQNGRDQTAKKISDETPKERVVVKLDPKIYDQYAGQYELAPGTVFTVKRDGGKLMAQLTGQPSVEVFPESETNFFYNVVDAQLTFEKNSRGEVVDLILHQNGADLPAKRMK